MCRVRQNVPLWVHISSPATTCAGATKCAVTDLAMRFANAAQASYDQTGNGSPRSEHVTIRVKIAPQSHGNLAFWSDATAFSGKLFKFLVELRSSLGL